MKKELKDYLHLYLGCEAQFKYTMRENDFELRIGKIIALYKNGIVDACDLRTNHNGIVYHNYKQDIIKPILRPLSDMTEDERNQFESSKVFVKATPVHQVGNMQWTPETFKYLLSIGIDLFGLINDGLAIDKTTLIPTP